jgi:hypothetical protein
MMKGYLPHPVVKAVVFWVLTLCIVCITTASILMAWDSVEIQTARNFIKSALALAGGALAFLFVNLAFGGLFTAFASPRPSIPLDPAFRDRLQRAKEAGESEARSKAE